MANEYTNHALNNEPEQKVNTLTDSFLFKVYLYLVLAFAFAGVAGIVISYIFDALFASRTSDEAVLYWLVTFVASFVLILIFTMIVNFQSIRNRNSVLLLCFYALVWGVFIGCFVFLLDNPLLVGGAFLVSATVFLGASVIGYFMRNRAHKILAMVAGGLLIGVLACCLLTFIFIPIIVFGGYNSVTISLYWANLWLYLIIQAAILLYMVIMVAVMTYRIKHMDQANLPPEVKNSLAVSVALSLFATFINIFLRVLYFLVLLLGNKK